jgi:hypothetical protein
MPHRKPKFADFLNPRQLQVVAAWSGDLIAAAKAAGYKQPRLAAGRLMKNRVFVQNLKRKQESMAEESGKNLGRQIAVSRPEIINRLWELARMSPAETNRTIYGQIKAAETLAYVFDIKLNRPADLDREVRERTSDEVDFFVEHGYFPDSSTPGQEPGAATTTAGAGSLPARERTKDE